MHRVIPDANIVLHFRRFDELDWPALVGPGPVTVVVGYMLVKELDKKKSEHPIKAIRDRIVDRQRWLLALRDTKAAISDTVAVEFRVSPPDLDFAQHGLDRDSPDDFYVAAALKEQADHRGHHVIVLTDDMGLNLAASDRDITVVRPSQADRLPSGLDEVEKLQKELHQLRSRNPKPAIRFASADLPLLEVPFPRYQRRSESELEIELDRYKAEHPRIDPETPRAAVPPANALGLKIALPDLTLLRPSREAREHYNEALKAHFEEYRSFLEKREEFHEAHSRLIPVTFTVSNDGTAPADDVDLTIALPEGCAAVDVEKPPEEPKPPKPPKKPNSAFAAIADVRGLSQESFLRRLGLGTVPIPDETRPYVEEENPRLVSFHFRRLKQNASFDLKPLYIFVMDDVPDGANLPLCCTLNSASLPTLIETTLTVGLRTPEPT